MALGLWAQRDSEGIIDGRGGFGFVLKYRTKNVHSYSRCDTFETLKKDFIHLRYVSRLKSNVANETVANTFSMIN